MDCDHYEQKKGVYSCIYRFPLTAGLIPLKIVIIKKTRLRPGIVIHSSFTQQVIMLIVPYESINGIGQHLQKREILEPGQRAERCRLQNR